MEKWTSELAYQLTQEQRHRPCELINYSFHIKVKEVYDMLDETHKVKFGSCCFRNLLQISDRNTAYQIMNQLIVRQKKCVDNKEVWFVIGEGKMTRFGIEELVLVTGLNDGEDNFDKSLGKESPLVTKYFKNVDDLYRIELWDAFESCSVMEDKYKLGLLVILAYVVASMKEKSVVPLWWFELVENLEDFEKYPWAEVCLKQTMKTFRQDLTNQLLSENVRYPVFGFPHAFVVWALESIEKLRTFGEIVGEDEDVEIFPRMLKWKLQKRLLGVRVDHVLELKETMVIPKLEPTKLEAQQPYWASIVCRKENVSVLEENVEVDASGDEVMEVEGAQGVDYEKLKKIVTDVVRKENAGIYSMMDRLKKEIERFRSYESCKKLNREDIIHEEMKVTDGEGEGGEAGSDGKNDEKEEAGAKEGKNIKKQICVGNEGTTVRKDKAGDGLGKKNLIEEGTSSMVPMKRRKLMTVESFDPYRPIEGTKEDGLKKWLKEYQEGKVGEIVELSDGTAPCKLLKTILDGGSMSSTILNTSLYEIRRRASDYPNLFEEGRAVLDVYFQHFTTVKYEEMKRKVIPWMLKMDRECEGGRGSRRFKVVKLVKLPTQANGTDCGMFAFKFIEFMMAKVDLKTMDASFMRHWRKKLVAELLACQFDP